MQGTPYIYQGEELGMTNVRFEDISLYQDIEIRNMYKERLEKGYKEADIMESIYAKGRDNARTPMQWTAGKNAGFTQGTPWIGVNPNYTEINAEEELKNMDSVFHYYKKLIALRKNMRFLQKEVSVSFLRKMKIFLHMSGNIMERNFLWQETLQKKKCHALF